MSSKLPAFKQTTTHVALPEQSLKNEKRMKQVSAHACIYHGVAIICSVWVRAYLGNYKMATAKSRTLHKVHIERESVLQLNCQVWVLGGTAQNRLSV